VTRSGKKWRAKGTRAQDAGSKLKFLAEAVVREEEEVKADEERTKGESKGETKVSTERNERAGRGGGIQRRRGKTPALVLLIKRLRGDASGLITKKGRA